MLEQEKLRVKFHLTFWSLKIDLLMKNENKKLSQCLIDKYKKWTDLSFHMKMELIKVSL